MKQTTLPPLALSVRQPWAWAIIHAGKDIENRSAGSIRAGKMTIGPVCIHAAVGLKKSEYDWAVWRLEKHGKPCPRPDVLIRGGIIGVVDVMETVDHSDSEWFGGQMGLRLENPRPVSPIPCTGALGYFKWQRNGALAQPSAWMRSWARPNDDAETLDLFPATQPSFASPPPKPWQKTRK